MSYTVLWRTPGKQTRESDPDLTAPVAPSACHYGAATGSVAVELLTLDFLARAFDELTSPSQRVAGLAWPYDCDSVVRCVFHV